MRTRAGLLAASAILTLAACSPAPTPSPPPPCPTEAPSGTAVQVALEGAERATVTTSKGTFTVELLPDTAPVATASFVALARCGFFDEITFHRVLAGFVIQAGDPQTRDNRGDFAGLGTGGPGYQFEIEPPPAEIPFDAYVVAMANDGRANGSQFFITLSPLDEQLRAVGSYSIFGRVIEGTEVIDEIAAVPINDPQIGVPLEAVIIGSIEIGGAPGES